jgi:peptide subunit release factor RF-3
MSFLNRNTKKKNFGIISHPDGKTTLTEKLLPLVVQKWCVKNNKIKKRSQVISWKLNVREGSVSTCFSFNYKEKKINILDTQGTRILQKIPLEL